MEFTVIATTRSLATATAALMGAGVIAAAPALTATTPAIPRFAAPDIALTSSIIDILTFPVWQQAIANEVEFVAIRAAGLAEAGVGLAESAAQLPAALLTATQQVFSGNALDALTTIETWAFDAGSATLVPPIAANIEVGQIQLAIQSALLLAQPVAAVELGAGLFTAFDTVTRSFIIAGQSIVDAVLSFDIGGIVQAVIDGVTGVISAFGAGGQALVDGVGAAQTTLAAALATRPIQILPIGPTSATPKSAAADAVTTAVTVAALPPAARTSDSPAAAPDEVPGTEQDGPTSADVRSASASAPQHGADARRTGADARRTGATERNATAAATIAGAYDDSTRADSRQAATR